MGSYSYFIYYCHDKYYHFICHLIIFYFFKSSPEDMLIDLKEGERKGEGDSNVREKHWWFLPICATIKD